MERKLVLGKERHPAAFTSYFVTTNAKLIGYNGIFYIRTESSELYKEEWKIQTARLNAWFSLHLKHLSHA